MDVTGLIALGLSLVDKILENLNINARRKYSDMWFKNEEEIRDERAKWPDSDDRKLEMLYDRRKDIARAAEAELLAATKS